MGERERERVRERESGGEKEEKERGGVVIVINEYKLIANYKLLLLLLNRGETGYLFYFPNSYRNHVIL